MVAHAQALGLNVARFKDMKAPATLAQVVYERNLSTALGVRGTLAFHQRAKDGRLGSYSGFKALVEQ